MILFTIQYKELIIEVLPASFLLEKTTLINSYVLSFKVVSRVFFEDWGIVSP